MGFSVCWTMQLLLHGFSCVLMVVCSTGRACASCLRTWSVPWRCRGPARRLSLWETARCSPGCALVRMCWPGCAGVLCAVGMCSVIVAVWARLGPWLAGTWAGVALAGGRCGCAASVMSWSAGAAGWAAREGGSVARSMTLSFITIVPSLTVKVEGQSCLYTKIDGGECEKKGNLKLHLLPRPSFPAGHSRCEEKRFEFGLGLVFAFLQDRSDRLIRKRRWTGDDGRVIMKSAQSTRAKPSNLQPWTSLVCVLHPHPHAHQFSPSPEARS